MLAMTISPRAAEAHAILEDSTPKPDAAILAGATVLTLRFNSRIDRARSRFTLTRPDRVKITLPIDPSGPPEILTAAAALTPGAHTLRWQVLAIDGHITRGDLAFTVTGL